MKTAFVTGGTGFLGLNLVEELTRQGWQVTALHRPDSGLGRLTRFGPRLACGDILDPASLEAAMPERVDAVFHLAADTSVWSRNDERQTRVNVEGTRNVLNAAIVRGARCVVHTSTWNTYGLEQGVISETTPQTGGGSWINYNRSKYLAEEEVRKEARAGRRAVIINPSHIVGRYDTKSWGRLILMAATGKLPGIPPGSGTFCHAEQVAKAQIAAVERGRSDENYLLDGADASFVEVIGLVGELTGRKVPKRPLPAWVFRAFGHLSAGLATLTGREPDATPEGVAIVLAHARVASDKAARELGYQPAPLRRMVEDALGWLKAEGLIRG